MMPRKPVKLMLLGCLFFVLPLWQGGAESFFLQTLRPKDARTMALGGTYGTTSRGYGTLYGNPAGFSLGKAQFATFSSLWIYAPLSEKNIHTLLGSGSKEENLHTLEEILLSNGFGGGALAGLGISGNNLGLGITLITDNYGKGETGAQDPSLYSQTQGNLIIGMAVPLTIGSATLAIGGDVRPFFRIEGNTSAMALIQNFVAGGIPQVFTGMLDKEGRFGVGLALDLGLLVQFDRLEMGLTVRDIGFPFPMGTVTYQETLQSFAALSLPRSKGSLTDSAQPIPEVNLGFRWAPYGVPGILEPLLLLEIQDPISVFMDGASWWNLLHLGLEVKTLSFLSLRTGFNKGWISGGLALNLTFCTIEGAIFTEELGLQWGSQPRSGFSLTAALHF